MKPDVQNIKKAGSEFSHHETHLHNTATAMSNFELIYTHHAENGGPISEYHFGSHIFPNTILQ